MRHNLREVPLLARRLDLSWGREACSNCTDCYASPAPFSPGSGSCEERRGGTARHCVNPASRTYPLAPPTDAKTCHANLSTRLVDTCRRFAYSSATGSQGRRTMQVFSAETVCLLVEVESRGYEASSDVGVCCCRHFLQFCCYTLRLKVSRSPATLA